MIKVLLISAAITALLFFSLDKVFPLSDNVEYSTIITDKNGDVIHAYLTKDDKWRMKTSLDEISPLLRRTIIQKEDKYFYYHVGINPFAIARAMISNLLHLRRTSGASTITMQVARALEKRPRTYANKLIEIFRAWQIEKKYNKDEIVQLYCNLLPYGGNIEGVKAAALLYFQKDPNHLSLAEITALSIVPNRPSSLVPGKNNEAIRIERNKWLKRFAKEKVFTEKQIADALAEPVMAERRRLPGLAPHLSYELKKMNGTEIHSSLDINLQSKIEKIVGDYARQLKLKNIRNAAVVVIDNKSHQVVSYVGSANFYDTTDGGQVNGINAIRQPGSTLKPLLYAMSIDEGLLTPKSIINDVNVNYGGYAPENYNKQFKGYVTMEYALEHSLNVPAVRMLDRLGTPKFIQALATCNFQQVKKDQKKLGLSMILGGCGATLFELAGLYSAFANNGKYFRPSLIVDTTAVPGLTIMSPAAAFMINETLSKINRPDFPLNWQSTEHMPKIAWKTGTSYGRRDAWSIGYNKKYTVAVWTGNFSGTGVADLSGAEVATPLLFRVFNTVDYDSDREWFSQPDDCDIRMVCAETGMPPAPFCKHIITDYFVPLVSPSKLCDNMEEVVISADGKISYCRSCMPLNNYRKKWYKVILSEIQRFYDERGIAYEKIPPHNPECEQLFKNGHPTIVSPSPGFEYLISKKDPEPLQLQCRAGNDVSRVYWYVDNHFYKMGDVHASLYFVPKEGPVKISCTDDKGRNKDIWIKVKYVDL